MNGLPSEQWEEWTRQKASALPYPPTPDVAEQVRRRLASERNRPVQRHLRPTWALVVILAILVGLLAVPPVRAAILEFLQIGAVRIWLVEPTPALPLTPPQPITTPEAQPRSTPMPTPTPFTSLFDLAGQTTLEEAEKQTGFAIRLPTYPPNLGLPDAVFYQELGGPVVVLLWLDPEQPEQALYSLHILDEGAIVEKGAPTVVMTTTVHDQPAAWTQGPYMLAYRVGGGQNWDFRRIVSDRVLVWFEDGLTYRLESNLPLEEARRMAESLE
jgi:hypothetical protein